MLRCVNPARKFMVWNRKVREGTATFRAYRDAMTKLVAEVRPQTSAWGVCCMPPSAKVKNVPKRCLTEPLPTHTEICVDQRRAMHQSWCEA